MSLKRATFTFDIFEKNQIFLFSGGNFFALSGKIQKVLSTLPCELSRSVLLA